MKIVNVNLQDRSYPIYIGTELLGNTQLFEPHVHGRKVLVVTNSTIEPLYAKTVVDAISSLAEVDTFVLPDGEVHKNLGTINTIFNHLIDTMCDRSTTVVALGGGVVGDIAGFAAACYQRGVPYIQIPTTLLAQVDSSVGGKTGVNHKRGKNMIGAFYQPQCVVADTETLSTLPDREFKAGLAEVIKYGAIRDASFFSWLESEIESLLNRNPENLAYVIEQSCQNKSEVVLEDERESGMRAILNFGHTFGHAIETWLGYENWLHGEAVAAGMVMASDLSAELEWLDQAESVRIKQLIGHTGLPTRPPNGMNAEDFLELTKLDKKVQAGKIRLILLTKIGKAVISDDYPQTTLERVLNASTAG